MTNLAYTLDLAKKNYEAIGFIPKPRLEAYADSGQLWMEYEDGEACGFLVFGNGFPILRIYQACIQYDSRRREHGFNLIGRLIKYADEHGYEAISCWCANDLDANEFWKAAGFVFSGQRNNGNRRGRLHNRWMYWLTNSKQLRLFSTPIRIGP